MSLARPVYVHQPLRTPRGAARPEGAFAAIRPVELLKGLFIALRDRGLDEAAIDDLLIGCNTQVGDQGANVAHTAALYAGFAPGVAGGTVQRFCCSGLDAIRAGVAQIASGLSGVVIAGGVESMSRAPMFSDKGAWFADPHVAKATHFVHMGVAADLLATRHGISREACDAYALRSQRRAAVAEDEERFVSRIPLAGLKREECVRPGTTVEKLGALPPAFEAAATPMLSLVRERYGQSSVTPTHTVGTSPALCDAASIVVLADEDRASVTGGPPRARIVGAASLATDPITMLEGPAEAVRRACAQAQVSVAELDFVECNESFAATALYAQRELDIADEDFNPNGGAIAMGHPLGATGGILLGTAIDELERRDATLAAVTIPAGGGIAMALVVERV